MVSLLATFGCEVADTSSLPVSRALSQHRCQYPHESRTRRFEKDGIDLAIRFGAGKWSGVRAIKLADEELLPVCSPNFNEGELPTKPAELLKFPLPRDLNPAEGGLLIWV